MRPSLPVALATAAALAAVGGGATVAGASSAQQEQVTLRLQRVYDSACRCYKLRFSGTISSGQANEYVAVLRQKCGSAFATAIAGGSTRAGGFWEAEWSGPRVEDDSSTYRARWNDRLSEALVFRAKVRLSLSALGGDRYRVNVDTWGTDQSMNGRRVELQRLVAGRWIRVRQATLRGGGTRFTATVVARGRGQSFRILVPARTAAPCFIATTSRPWVAGRPPAPGSATVIDRTLLCSVADRGGLRMIEVRAASLTPPGGPTIPTFSLLTNWLPDATLASASTGGMQVNPTRCTATSARVALTAQGLRGGVAPASEQEYECETPRRVLVRIRAVFSAPMKLESDRTFGYEMLRALGEVREAALAIRTQTGRTLAFASLVVGKARLFAAPSCNEDT